MNTNYCIINYEYSLSGLASANVLLFGRVSAADRRLFKKQHYFRGQNIWEKGTVF